MLYYLLYHVLQRYFSPLNVFRYITVRTVYASLTAMFLGFVFGPWLIRSCARCRSGNTSAKKGPRRIRRKQARPRWAAC